MEADDSGASVSLDAIVAGLNDETLSRITIGKYIKWLFPKAIPRRSVFKVDGRGVNRIGSYIGLKWTDWSSESQSDVQQFSFPEYITVCNLSEDEVMLCRPTETVRNGEIVNMNIKVSRSGHLEVSCLGKIVDLQLLHVSSTIGWSQKDFNKLFILLNYLKICTGFEVTPDSNNDSIIQWSTVTDENVQHSKHSPSCKYMCLANVGPRCNSCSTNSRGARRIARSRSVSISDTEASMPEDVPTSQVPPMEQQPSTSYQPSTPQEPSVSTDDTQRNNSPATTHHDTSQLSAEQPEEAEVMLEKMFPSAPENMKELLLSQTKNLTAASPYGRRWSSKMIGVALRLWCRSPKAYEVLRETGVLILPSVRLLSYYKNVVQQKPGINADNLEGEKKTVKDIPNQEKKGGKNTSKGKKGTETKAKEVPVLSPEQTIYKCGVCQNECVDSPKTADEDSIGCDSCELWFHYPCVGLTGKEPFLSRKRSSWFCAACEKSRGKGKGRGKKSRRN